MTSISNKSNKHAIAKPVSLFALLIVLSLGALAQTGRSSEQAPGKDILLSIVHNADKSFGYTVTDHGTVAFTLNTAPGMKTGYATIQEAVAAAGRLQKLLQANAKNPNQMTKQELNGLVQQAGNEPIKPN